MQTRNVIPISYQATNPYQQENKWFSFLNKLFPSSSLGTSVGKLVLPAQMRTPSTASECVLHRLGSQYLVQVGFVNTHDLASLHTIQLIPTETLKLNVQDQYFIIKFNGNGMHYQDLINKYAKDSDKLQATIVGFNYRGVSTSKKTPETFQDLVTDGIAQVNRLIEGGADPEKITLDGLSLGGAVATMVAKYFHDKNIHLYLWNDRSLASISKVTAGVLTPEMPSLFANLSFASLETTSWSLLKSTGWEADIAKAYKSIPNEYKGYMVVAKRSEKSSGDGVISHRASLHTAVKEDEKQQNHRTGSKVLACGIFSRHGGHNESRTKLVSKSDPSKNAQDIFEDFVMRQRR